MRWWLSFADPHLPKGQQFLGVAIVEAPDFIFACRLAKTLGCNPGGEVRGWEVPDSYEGPPPLPLNRLMSKSEMEALGHDMVTLDELEEERGAEIVDDGCAMCGKHNPEHS